MLMFLVLVLVLTIALNASGIEPISPSVADESNEPVNASDINEPVNASDIYEPASDDVTTASGIDELCSYMRKVHAGIHHAKNFCKASDACEGLSKFFLDIMRRLSRKAIEHICG